MTEMGGEEYQGLLQASSMKDAILLYQKLAPLGCYNNTWFRITDTRVLQDEFVNPISAFEFLFKKITKWSNYAVLCKCGDNQYAYAVIYPA